MSNAQHGIKRRNGDGYECDTASSENTETSPSPTEGSIPASNYRLGGGKSSLNNKARLIETPVYTFVLPDLTIYPGSDC